MSEPAPIAAAVAAASNPQPGEPGVDILALREGICRYPLPGRDAAPYRYCGAASVAGESWCPAHASRVFESWKRRI